MNFWRVAVPIVATVMLSASPARACLCQPPGPPCEEFWRADAVFVGKVTAVQPFEKPAQSSGATIMLRYRRFSIDVQKVYRGEVGAQVDVVSRAGGNDCGINFKPGDTYLVYAGVYGGVLYTSGCSRTRSIHAAQEDIAWLEMWPTLPPGATIFGNVKRNVRADGSQKSPLAGVAITARNSAGQERKTNTDTEGGYVFRGLEPGEYGLTPDRPSTLFWGERSGEPVRQPEKAQVQDRGCAEVNFITVANGRIRGHVFDANGSPVSHVGVGVQYADAAETGHASIQSGTLTSLDGSFEISGLPAGTYIAIVNSSGPGKESPYPRRFFPDTADIDKASPIEVGEAEEVKNIDFKLPQKLASSIVEVLVVDSDGKPFKGAHTIAQNPMTSPEIVRGTNTGSDGISRLDLFAEGVYSISARAEPDGIFRCSGPVAVYAGDTRRITLKLGPPGQTCRISLGN